MGNSRLPSLLALRAYEAVARNGSMKLASKELHVTPGAISQLVRKLEDQLEVKLLKRVNRGFTLTKEGRKLKNGLNEGFTKIYTAVDATQLNMDRNKINIACDRSFAAKWLVPRINNFLEIQPEIDIKILSSRNLIESDIQDIDLFINLRKVDDTILDGNWLGEENMTVLGSPEFINKHEIESPSDVLGVPLLCTDINLSDNKAPTWEDWFHKQKLPSPDVNRNIYFGEYVEQAIDAAAAGAGLVLASQVLASMDIVNGKLKRLFKHQLKTNFRYQISPRKDYNKNRKVARLREWLEMEFEQSVSSNFIADASYDNSPDAQVSSGA